MDEDIDEGITVSGGYGAGQWARALVTAGGHADAGTRARAVERMARWQAVLAGMADGSVTVGARSPVAGLPAWVTLEVLTGGFATGAAVAGGPLTAAELEVVERVGLPAGRKALFEYCLSEPGLAELQGLLDSGCYRVDVPEEAALLVVAWLARQDQDAAGERIQELLAELAPFADRLRFTPTPAPEVADDPSVVQRETVGEVRAALARRVPNRQVAAMNEALAVWNPFGDELLALWLATCVDGRVAAAAAPAEPAWLAQGTELLERYEALAVAHPLCTKHRKPKENLAILRSALETVVRGEELSARRRGLLQHAVDAMVRRRGVPGAAPLTALRAVQAEQAARPTHAALAGAVDERLARLPQASGVRDVESMVAPVATADGRTAEVPSAVRRVVARATAGRLDELIDAGVVGSLEVVARLTPQLFGRHWADAYQDPILRVLMARHYTAFRNRRSLLLVNLQKQVSVDELPWIRAVGELRVVDGASRSAAADVLRDLGSQALGGFPGTLLPNRLVREFATLSRVAGLGLPWVEELAADIFMGEFSAKYLDAAQWAGRLLSGSLYEDYYGINYDILLAMDDVARRTGDSARTSSAFDQLCLRRAALPKDGSPVARNGMVVEQAQILTTHNLATLAGGVGVVPAGGWAAAAHAAFHRVCALAEKTSRVPRPLPVIKDTAYAWRHLVFYAALLPGDEQAALRAWLRRTAHESGDVVSRALGPVLAGLEDVMDGEDFGPDGTSTHGRRLLGWSATGHWFRHLFGDRRRVAYKS